MPVIPTDKQLALRPRCTPGSRVERIGTGGWRLAIQPGPAGKYRLAQLDDYAGQRRGNFHWRPPLTLSLWARACGTSLPGTWGFGLWNDPFTAGMIGGAGLRLPALPNAAWFFFASPHNYLSLRDELPGNGALAATFRSPTWSPVALAPAWLLAPLLLLPPFARLARRIARNQIAQDAVQLEIDPVEWHAYHLNWEEQRVLFHVDGCPVLDTSISPVGPLGLVLWVDNQYAAFTPDGHVKFGSLGGQDVTWIEVDSWQIGRGGLDGPGSVGSLRA
jgi:hypothetical protein